jgi:tetratricopeptide (TPR) repeat protein
LGRSDEAALDLKAGLTLARTIGDKTLECELLNGLGTLHDYMGRMDAALNDYEQALAVARQIDNRRWEGGVLGNLGNVYYSQGEIAKARAAYEAGLVVARELGNRQWEGDTLCNLGLLRHVQGESEEARSMLGNSLQVAREIGHARLEAIVLCNLGLVEGATERSTAGQHFTAALAIAEVLGDQRLQGQTLGYLGLLLTRQGHPREGRRQLDRGKDVLLSVKDELSLALLQCASAEAHLLNGDRSQALTDLEVAREIAERLGGDAVVFDLRLALTRAEEQLLKSHASVTRC